MPRLAKIKTVWGLDVAASAIKGIRMGVEEGRVQILEADILPLDGEPPAGEAVGRDRRIWQALQRFEAKYGVSRDRVAVGLPGFIFFSRPFSIVLVGDKPEAELVRYEMEQHIPFGLDAVLWDYEVFPPADGEGGPRERDGLLFAMKKEVLNNYLLSLSSSRIDPVQIQAAPLALYNFVQHEFGTDEPVLVADIGAATTSLLAIAGNRYWIRTISSGGETLTAAIRAAFRPQEVSYEDAVRIKANLTQVSRRGEVIERITPALRGFVGEMRNAVKHLQQEHKQRFNRLTLLGGGSGMYGLQRLLGEELGMRVITPAGLGRIEVPNPATAAYVNANLPALATAIGLGLQGVGRAATRVNMVSATLAERRTQTVTRRTAVSVVAASAAIIIGLGAFSTARKAVYSNGAEKLANAVRPINERAAMAERAIRPGEAEERMGTLERLAAGRSVWLTVLDRISNMLPENEKATTSVNDKMWLMRLAVRPKPGAPGVYEGEIEAGMRVRADGKHRDAAERILLPPLKAEDARAVYSNVEVAGSRRSPLLDFKAPNATDKNPDQYFLIRLKFDVTPKKGGGL